MTVEKTVETFIDNNIGKFHADRTSKLSELNLAKLLGKKSPFLYTFLNKTTPDKIVSQMLDPYLSSSIETTFGSWMEKLAIDIACNVYGGFKSSIKGIDFEMIKDDVYYIFQVKSGPNWGNASQIESLERHFQNAKRQLAKSVKMPIVAINGCMYGTAEEYKSVYWKYCGKKFWELVSGDSGIYLKLIDLLSYKSKEYNDQFDIEYSNTYNRFLNEFTADYCDSNGQVNYDKILKIGA